MIFNFSPDKELERLGPEYLGNYKPPVLNKCQKCGEMFVGFMLNHTCKETESETITVA